MKVNLLVEFLKVSQVFISRLITQRLHSGDETAGVKTFHERGHHLGRGVLS